MFLLLALLLSLTLGCGVGGLIGGGTETPSAVEEIEEAEQDEEAEPVEEVEEAEEMEEGEEDVSIASVTDGLQDLDSYRSNFTMVFEGGGSSEGEEWTLEMDIEYVRDPLAQRIAIQGGGMGEMTEGGMESIRIGDQQYVVVGDQCISSSVEDDAMDMGMFEIDDVMGGLENAQRVLPDETINGILCRHYVFDQTALAWAALTQAEGEAWIAVDGDYVVKYTLVADGQDPASQQEGHLEWEYEVLAVNESFTIEAPAGCDAAESEFPIMPDATNVTTFGGMLSYQSSSSLDEVTDFYQEQMQAQGWSDTGDSFITTGTAMLNYVKDDRKATVTLTGEDGTVSVIIMSE
jgi:hypothetical protein